MDKKAIKLHVLDNVQIVIEDINQGDFLALSNERVLMDVKIGIGSKIADQTIQEGQKIMKYGVPIGSATTTIEKGEWVHLHNMKSDYIPTFTHHREFKEDVI
ncbi:MULTISPECIES: UxaA family hydrolase [Sphingobacterium]|uniref:UxaA family hydrolase n=1 Tax=Sphingobacterium TaxID=28453 RepID=UPI0013DD55AC|nr:MULTISPECIES: UxaA family hydrolase [unclassified Sphingobacterium]